MWHYINCEKKLVYWGTGAICRMCLDFYPEKRPEFFIDSNKKTELFNGKKVYSPSEIDEWADLFVVIVNTATNAVASELEKRGCKRNENFLSYIDYFGLNQMSTKESLNHISNLIKTGDIKRYGILICAPFMQARNASVIQKFFSEFNKLNKSCIGISNILPYTENKVAEIMGFPVLQLPELCRWDGIVKDSSDYGKESLDGITISTAEETWIEELEERKLSSTENSLLYTKILFAYVRDLFTIMEPSKVIIWGGWSRFSYILAENARKNNIPYGFMEWGWIPGTLQFDPVGIAGQSDYAINPESFYAYKTQACKAELVEKIKDYVLKKQLDTGVFKNIPEDELQLKKLNSTKKTVLLVGMGDAEMGMNPNHAYWSEYISDIVSSTKDSYNLIRDICKNNNFNFIYKPHPHSRLKSEDDKYRSDLDTIYITDMSIDELIDMSDVVVSIASAVDYKVLMYTKALVSLGKMGFKNKDCVYEVSSRKEVESKLLLAIEKGMTMEQISNYNRFLLFLLENYLWDDLSHPDFKYGLSINKDFFDEHGIKCENSSISAN